MLTVAVGSLNPVKIAAVRSALEIAQIEATVGGIAVPSGVPDQPIGYAQIALGARNRAQNARAAQGAAWGFGLEGGVEFEGGQAWLYSVVAVVTAAGEAWLAQGGKLLLPPPVAARLRDGEELGPVMDSLTGVHNSKQKLGAVGFLTGGVVRREDGFRDCVGRAIAPLLHPELYRA